MECSGKKDDETRSDLVGHAQIIVILLAGCAEPALRSEADSKPLTLTFVQIYQSISGGVMDPSYLGTLRFPHCGRNDNDFTVRSNGGFEIYQPVPGTNGTSLRLVKEQEEMGWGVDMQPGGRVYFGPRCLSSCARE